MFSYFLFKCRFQHRLINIQINVGIIFKSGYFFIFFLISISRKVVVLEPNYYCDQIPRTTNQKIDYDTQEYWKLRIDKVFIIVSNKTPCTCIDGFVGQRILRSCFMFAIVLLLNNILSNSTSSWFKASTSSLVLRATIVISFLVTMTII